MHLCCTQTEEYLIAQIQREREAENTQNAFFPAVSSTHSTYTSIPVATSIVVALIVVGCVDVRQVREPSSNKYPHIHIAAHSHYLYDPEE